MRSIIPTGLLCSVLIGLSSSHSIRNVNNENKGLTINTKCGREDNSIPPEIMGEPLQPWDFPWMALIGTSKGELFDILCVGVVVSSKFVLSPGWCIDTITIPTHVRVGDYDAHTKTRGYPDPTDYYIIKIHEHDNYDLTTRESDFGLIEVDRRIEFSHTVQPACLPFGLEDTSFVNSKLYVSGFTTHEDYEISPDLRKKALAFGERINVVSNQRCIDAYNDTPIFITDENICVGGEKGDVCLSSQDAALHYYDGQNKRYTVVGMISLIPKQCDEKSRKPSMLTNLAKHLEWITSIVS